MGRGIAAARGGADAHACLGRPTDQQTRDGRRHAIAGCARARGTRGSTRTARRAALATGTSAGRTADPLSATHALSAARALSATHALNATRALGAITHRTRAPQGARGARLLWRAALAFWGAACCRQWQQGRAADNST